MAPKGYGLHRDACRPLFVSRPARRDPLQKRVGPRVRRCRIPYVILYGRPDGTARSRATTRLTVLAAEDGYRYVIRVTPGRSTEQQLATLGHEMRHAVAIAVASEAGRPASTRFTAARSFERDPPTSGLGVECSP
jgi:hypothetical protein